MSGHQPIAPRQPRPGPTDRARPAASADRLPAPNVRPAGDMSRDYVAEMRAVIDAEATGTYVPGVVAAAIVEKLRETDPDMLSGWLDAQAETFIRQAINNRDNSQRTAARHSRPRSAFAKDAEAAEAGEPERLAGWLSTRFTIGDGSRKPLAEMGKEDLLFVGDAYDARARENKLTAAFVRAIARKVKSGTVADYFTDDALSVMWDSLTSR